VADIVIAVNPYQWLTELYTEKVRLYYAQKLVWEKTEDDPRVGLPPHIYEVSSLCYKGLAVGKTNQSILVSGESGAGKTETVKIAMNHIASVQQDPDVVNKEEGDSKVVQRILDSNPLLEAFGNAKTRRNDNSSRFGKYIMLQFECLEPKEKGAIPRAALAGSKCDVYLLEKSRVVYHDETERTYHVFYQLINASEEEKVAIWKGLSKTTNESYAYIGKAPKVLIDGMEDCDHFKLTTKALDLIGVNGETYITLFQAIAAVLQLGNLTFASKPDTGDEESIITSMPQFKELATLIGCDETLLSLAFTERTIKTRGEEYKVPLKMEIAKESADAFGKEIYAKVFLWLVRAINDATCAENNWPAADTIEYGIIGLLDIFGFESFPINGFEQLCINYCNEKLQAKFTQDIFRTVVLEYQAEGLNMADIKYDDNTDVLDLIEGKLGLIKQLNEECVRPKGNDEAFVSKALNSNKAVACLIVKQTFRKTEFGICHFAGPVIYMANDFVMRNTDTLPADIQACAKTCKNEIIAKHLDNEKCSNQVAKSAEPDRAAPKRAKSSLAADTV
jgi:myosin-5